MNSMAGVTIGCLKSEVGNSSPISLNSRSYRRRHTFRIYGHHMYREIFHRAKYPDSHLRREDTSVGPFRVLTIFCGHL